MVRKIISGGQTGVELAALDVAVKLGIAHGGWIMRGQRNESGPVPPDRYNLKETPALGFAMAVEQNVLDADGMLLVSRGHKSVETKHAVQMALKHQRHLLHVDLRQHPPFEAASLFSSWTILQRINVVFITGSKASADPDIYRHTQKMLETAFFLSFVKSGLHPQHPRSHPERAVDERKDFPKSVSDAVQRLKSVLPLKDRAFMANMQTDEVAHLRSGLGDYIKQNFGLYTGNGQLMQSCAKVGGLVHPLPDEACAVILRALWKDLQKTHRLRVVK